MTNKDFLLKKLKKKNLDELRYTRVDMKKQKNVNRDILSIFFHFLHYIKKSSQKDI